MTISPYRYMMSAHVRRHGPAGYSAYGHYRPWLRDDFCFRCVYCLERENWAAQDGGFELDHDIAKSLAPELCREYTNLVYACHNCNKRKSNKRLPSVSDVAYGACMEVSISGKSAGEIHALNADGEKLIDELALDARKITQARRLRIETLRTLEKHNKPLFMIWMGFPEDLPDLAAVHPQPTSNSKPEGIEQSWLARKNRGQLPATYE
jgi:hypothetical protein